MNDKELYELYEKISDFFLHYRTYHCIYIPMNSELGINGTYLTFEVLVSSDQGEGSEWIEDWGINNDGSIYSPYNTYKDFDEFKIDF